MIFLYIVLMIVVFLVIGYFSFLIGAKAVGIKSTLRGLLLPVLSVTGISAIFGLLRLLTDGSPFMALLPVTGLLLGVVAWHKLLQRSHMTTVGKSIGSYAIGSILIWIATLILGFTAVNYVQSYQMTGNSMAPVLQDKDRFLVYKKVTSLHKGDVIVYNYKTVTDSLDNPDEGQGVGRILGTPGETITPNKTYFNPDGLSIEFASYKLKDNEYYIVGDNSSVAFARIITPDSIIGKAGPILVKAN